MGVPRAFPGRVSRAFLASILTWSLLCQRSAQLASPKEPGTGLLHEGSASPEEDCPQSQQTYSPTPEAFLQKWMRSPSPDVCGHWQFEYGEAHKDIRSGFAPPRFITFVDPNTAPRNLVRPGLGDYLVGMATAFVVGLLTERAFVMEDSSLTQVVDVGEVNWRVGPDVPMGADKPDPKVVSLQFYNAPEKGWEDPTTIPVDALEFFGAYGDSTNIRLATNGGILARIFSNTSSPSFRKLHSLGLRLPSAFGCIIRYILRPKTEVWKQVVPALAVMRQPGVRVVGIHMRTTDVFAWKRGDYSLEYVWQQTHSSLLRCAQATADFFIADGDTPRWLFLADSDRLRRRVAERYKDLVISTGVTPLHTRFNGSQAMGSVLAEWLLFSTSDFFVITESGFAKTAAAFNINMPKMFLFSHFHYDQMQGKCDQARPQTLAHFHKWSGL